ncbi:MAG TPA: hypothetical protein VHU84_04770, partial [Lacipirellulaceae bacterium]|nr:hypothetical protein [Lacipirellulaceae bacterium]
MGLTRHLGRVTCAIGFLTLTFGASVRGALCEHSTYAYEDRVVVMTCDKTGAPELHVILLNDEGPLRVAGRVRVPSDRLFDTAGHFKNFLLLARWTKLEVYDFTDVAHPALAASFDLNKRGTFPGYDRIEQTAPNKILVMTSLGTVEVTADGEPSKWNVAELPPSKELEQRMSGRIAESQFDNQNEKVVVLRENARFRYELNWREKSSTGEILHRHYLRKV